MEKLDFICTVAEQWVAEAELGFKHAGMELVSPYDTVTMSYENEFDIELFEDGNKIDLVVVRAKGTIEQFQKATDYWAREAVKRSNDFWKSLGFDEEAKENREDL